MKVVLDTNVFVGAFLSKTSNAARILELLRLEAFELVVSEPILREYEDVLKYDKLRKLHKLTNEQISQLIEDISTIAILVEPEVELLVVRGDADDNMLFECALDGDAEFIISGDALVQSIKEYQGIRVLSPSLFLALF